MNPYERVVEAMPGTLRELSKATGYPIETILRAIRTARQMRVRVNAVMGPSRNVSRRVDPDAEVETIFTVDKRQ